MPRATTTKHIDGHYTRRRKEPEKEGGGEKKKHKETEDVKVQGHEVQVVNPVKEGKSVQGKSTQEQKNQKNLTNGLG